MKKFSLCFLLFFNAHAEAPFAFEKTKLRVTKGDYHRWIRPQLKSIISDFNTVLKHNHSFMGSYLNYRSNLNELHNYIKAWFRVCDQANDSNCAEMLRKINKAYYKLEKQSLTIIENDKIFDEQKTPFYNKKNVLSNFTFQTQNLNKSINFFNKQTPNLQKNLQIVDLALKRYILYNDSRKILPYQIEREVEFSLIETDLFLTEILNNKIQEPYNSVWINFIKVIESKIIPESNLDYLIGQLEDLNIVWNDFHLKISKGNLKTPRKIKQQLTIIQRRWNSVLKVILK